jgi:N-acyl-L-homoserine lactone synthetase
MRLDGIASALRHAMERFDIFLPHSPDELDDVFRLRFQVYCLERGFEPADNGRESDAFDPFARHALVRHRGTRQAVGTVRLVVPAPVVSTSGDTAARLPITQVCDSAALDRLPTGRSAEISRFALSKRFRAEEGLSDSLLRLLLMRGIVALSGDLGLTHWCALMEPCLLRLLRTTAIHFQPAGPLVEHHGLRQPSIGVIGDVLGRMEREQPPIWDFITDGGTLWGDPALRAAA